MQCEVIECAVYNRIMKDIIDYEREIKRENGLQP